MQVFKSPETACNYLGRVRNTSVFTVFSGCKNACFYVTALSGAISEKRKASVFTGFCACRMVLAYFFWHCLMVGFGVEGSG